VESLFALGISRRKKTGMKIAGAALAMLLLVGALMAAAQNASGPPIGSGVFTAAQAKRGDDAYQASCSSCHGSDLHATDAEAVDLTGPGFRAKWSGKTLGGVFEKIRDTMPLGNANSLGDKTYVDILAFILQVNGFPPGNQELAPDAAKAIVFVSKP
jgi:mono/diheme cytochrome c family protein